MESRKDIAAAKKAGGKYNCAQAVVTTYPELTGLSEADAMHLTDAFAAGMTTMDGTCGALTGAGIVLGMANKNASATRKQMRSIMTAFMERNKTVTCRELKGAGTHCVLRECPLCVADACEFLERQLAGRPAEEKQE